VSDNDTKEAAVAGAQDVMFQKVYVPEFVKQCAANGVAFDASDETQVASLLKIAFSLRARAEAEARAAAAGSRETIKVAADMLEADTFGDRAEQAGPSAPASELLGDGDVASAAKLLAERG
jgi:hypothetical protein